MRHGFAPAEALSGVLGSQPVREGKDHGSVLIQKSRQPRLSLWPCTSSIITNVMDVSLSELFLAYRQAKQALFQEHRTPDRLDIANAEAGLTGRLVTVRRNVNRGQWFDGLPLGSLWLPVKNAAYSKRRDTGVVIVDGPPIKTLRRLNLRLHLTPSLEFSTVEVVWLWKFGPALETTLTDAARGNRLNLRDGGQTFDLHGRDPFVFWPEAYRRFRDEGLNVAKSMLNKADDKCTVVTFDLSSYYDEIDPSFLVTTSFIEAVSRSASDTGITFDQTEYLTATRSLLAAFRRYRDRRTYLLSARTPRGIPIGALTSRVIANLALSHLDQHVLDKPAVRYYARYVDDILIVAAPGETSGTVWTPRSIAETFLPVVKKGQKLEIVLDSAALKRPRSRFVLQTQKLKVYELSGRRGRDFIYTIERDVRLISSERRDLINRDGLESESPLAGLLIGAEDRIPVQVLRDVDRLKVERYAANVAIGKVDTATKFIGAPDAAPWCRRQLRPLAEAVTDSDHWLEFYDTACRALGVSIRARDVDTSCAILERLSAQLRPIRTPRPGMSLFWNNRRVNRKRTRNAILQWFEVRLRQEVCASIKSEALASVKTVADELKAICGSEAAAAALGFDAERIRLGALLLEASDLRALDRESDYSRSKTQRVAHRRRLFQHLERALQREISTSARISRVTTFLKVCRQLRDPIYSQMTPSQILLMTRPPSTFDIGHRWSRAGRSISTLTMTINAVRGTRYRSDIAARVDADTIAISPPLRSPSHDHRLNIVLGNLTSDENWAWAAADGKPVLSAARLTSLAKVVNQSIRISRKGRKHRIGTLLVLPELSVPRAWIRLVAEHLVAENVGLVSGVEYLKSRRTVSNEAVGVFTSGFSMGVVCVWPKGKPAREEERELLSLRLKFKRSAQRPPLAVHTQGVTISTLICSELLEVERRAAIMGRIDLLLVPSWNRDTATFDHTVQTTANDVHCYVAIANTAEYSDCRVHCPSDERWKRDVCRLICRGQDETIWTDLDFGPLRDFQLASNDPSATPKGFKPVPPGFQFKRPV